MEIKEGRMEVELRNFILVWAASMLSLCYCKFVSNFVRSGVPRLMALLPVIFLFVVLPLHCLHSCHLGLVTVFCLSWIANFKLLLLSFNTGPLSDLSLPLLHFVALACFPIIKAQKSTTQMHPQYREKNSQMERNEQSAEVKECSRLTVITSKSNGLKSPLHYAKKAWALPFIHRVYTHRESIHPMVLVHIYVYYIYITIEIQTATIAMFTQWLLKLDLEQPFNEPYLSTSLRDFWGRRWNLVSTNILRATIFNPIFHYISKTLLGRTWALIFATMGTFLVSALMHELLYYQIFRHPPTWSFTYFFAIQGLCLVLEGGLKNKLAIVQRGFPPPVVFLFMMSTFVWLVMVDLVKQNADTVFVQQYIALWKVLFMNQVG